MDGELSEEQRAALEERRQRSDKISRLMGPYLLKRYRMLSEACNVCKVSGDVAIQYCAITVSARIFCCNRLKEQSIV